jgi:hypothetical protein
MRTQLRSWAYLPLERKVFIEVSITVHSSTDTRSVHGAFAKISPGKTHEDTRMFVAQLRRKRNMEQTAWLFYPKERSNIIAEIAATTHLRRMQPNRCLDMLGCRAFLHGAIACRHHSGLLQSTHFAVEVLKPHSILTSVKHHSHNQLGLSCCGESMQAGQSSLTLLLEMMMKMMMGTRNSVSVSLNSSPFHIILVVPDLVFSLFLKAVRPSYLHSFHLTRVGLKSASLLPLLLLSAAHKHCKLMYT